MPLNKKEIDLLLGDGWEIVCESPLEFEKHTQFSDCIHKLYTEEEQQKEVKEIKKRIDLNLMKFKIKGSLNNEIEIRFNGTISGDSECFCWEVDEGTYKHIAGEENYKIELNLRESYREDGMIEEAEAPWRVYPNDIFRFLNKKKYNFKIIVGEI